MQRQEDGLLYLIKGFNVTITTNDWNSHDNTLIALGVLRDGICGHSTRLQMPLSRQFVFFIWSMTMTESKQLLIETADNVDKALSIINLADSCDTASYKPHDVMNVIWVLQDLLVNAKQALDGV